MSEVIITNHAIERFLERSRKLGMVTRDPRTAILKLLKEAQPEQIDETHKVKRLISNGLEEVHYLVCQGWRIVLSKDRKRILTIERVRTEQN